MSKRLLFQGDSITDCGRLTCGGAGYSQEINWGPGYCGMIGSWLMGNQPEKQWTIFNRGISGNRVVDLYARWKIDCINLKPDIVSILIGVNDTWHEKMRQNGVEIPRYDQFYRTLLDWTLKELPQVKFILMEPFILPFGAVTDASWVKDIDKRRAVVKKIASDYKKHAVFVPLQKPLLDACKTAPQEYWLFDGVHPTPAGHQLIMNQWMKAAEKLLK